MTNPTTTHGEDLGTGARANWVFYFVGIGTAVLIAVVLIWRIPTLKDAWRWKTEGGVPAATTSNGFDLSESLVPADLISPSGVLKDHVKALQEPAVLSLAQTLKRSEGRGKLLVDSDLVIGVELDGQARAYPIRILNWHEIVNDFLGERPIAVTWSPLTGSVVIFDRRVNGETLQFGHSGLLYNRNLLLFDRRDDDAEESLWCQLQGRAVCGQAAGAELTRYSAQVLTWKEWRELKPDTTCIDGRLAYFQKKKYGEDPYGAYHLAGKLDDRYAVSPRPPEGEGARPAMARMIVIEYGGEVVPVFYADVASKLGADGTWSRTIGERRFDFHHGERPERVWFTTGGELPDMKTTHTFWYAWYALGAQ